jgi:molybdenum cofactor cytidylyltransferase
MRTPAIVLAAGASSRLGQPKQLVEFQGETLLMRATRLAQEAGADPVFVVLGANRELIAAAMLSGHAVAIVNDAWRDGISTSIRTGLRAVEQASAVADGVLLLACDQPFLTAELLRALLDAFTAQSGLVITASSYKGTIGTPAVFPRKVFPQLLDLRGDSGARTLLKDAPCAIVEVAFPGGEIDIDFPEDLKKLS